MRSQLVVAQKLWSMGLTPIPLDHPAEPISEKPDQVGKVPVFPWAQWQTQRPGPENLVEWFGNGHTRNIGIVTGKISNVVVIDLDNPEALAWATEHLPRTPMRNITAKGQHWFYGHPGVTVKNAVRVKVNGVELKVDIRADGGYVVAPGSTHVSGHRYQAPEPWPASLNELPVFDPAWFGSPVAEPAWSTLPAAPRTLAPLTPDRLDRVRAYLAKVPPAIAGQGGDLHTYQVCCRVVRGFDLSEGEAFEPLAEWNARNVPPWTESELRTKINGAVKYGREPYGSRRQARAPRPRSITDAEGEPARVFPNTDAGNGEYFAQRYADTVRFDHRRQHWRIWQSPVWAIDPTERVRRFAIETARQRYLDAADIADLDQRKAASKWATNTEQRDRLNAMLSIAQALEPIADPGDSWDSDSFLLACANGVIDLRTGDLREGSPDYRLTQRCSVAYDPHARADRWAAFVFEIFNGDETLALYLQKAIGYSATGETSEQVCFPCHGVGSNGKGTLFRVVSHVLGDYAGNLGFSTLELRGASSIPNDLAALVGRRFVTASETNDGTRINEARLKALTGEDPITARFMRAEFFTFRPVLKLWLGVNHKPVVRDQSFGFWRRIRLLPFTRRFPIDKTLEPSCLPRHPASSHGSSAEPCSGKPRAWVNYRRPSQKLPPSISANPIRWQTSWTPSASSTPT